MCTIATIATISISERGDPTSIFAVNGIKDRRALLQLFRGIGVDPHIEILEKENGNKHLFHVPCEIKYEIPVTGKNHTKKKAAVSALVTRLQNLGVPVSYQTKQSSSKNTNGGYRNDNGAHSPR